MYEFIRGRKKPGPYIEKHVERYRSEHRGIGPVVTAAALEGDGSCQEIMRLFGAILGQFVRDMVLTCVTRSGSVWLVSGVLQAPGMSEILIGDTLFYERVTSPGAEHSDF